MSTGPYRTHPPAPRAAAGKLACPGCGTEVDDSLRRCAACGTPIATVRCAACYHMSPPDSALCLGCGRELGLEPLGEPDALACPDCKRPFQRFQGGPGSLHDCSRCGGQFVDHTLLADLLEQREVYGRAAPRPPPRHNPLDAPMRYVACPACNDIMTRKNFGRSSGVIVDVCGLHGVWFDRGELPRVLEFVEAGGLALARQRAEDEARESAHRERAARIERIGESFRAPARLTPGRRALQGLELGERSLELLGVLADLMHER